MGSTVVEEHNSSIVNSNGGCPGGEDVMRFESCRLSSFAGKWPADAKVRYVNHTYLDVCKLSLMSQRTRELKEGYVCSAVTL